MHTLEMHNANRTTLKHSTYSRLVSVILICMAATYPGAALDAQQEPPPPPEMPPMPEIPEPFEFPEMPEMPEMPEFPEMPEMPEMPDVPPGFQMPNGRRPVIRPPGANESPANAPNSASAQDTAEEASEEQALSEEEAQEDSDNEALQQKYIEAIAKAELEKREEEKKKALEDETLKDLILVDMDGPSLLKLYESFTDKHVLSAQNLPAVKINFEMRTELLKSEAILAIESLLTLNGIGITEIGEKFLKAVPVQTISNQVPIFLEKPASELEPSQQIYTKLYTFDYLSVVNGEVQPLLQPILSQQGQGMVPFVKSNSMLITDSLINLQRVERIMQEADSPEPVDEDMIHFFQIKYVKASDLKSRLDSMINNTLRQYLQNNTTVEFDERTNQLIVVTHDSNLPLIERMIASFDIDVEPSTTSKVFYIKHAKAEEVDKLLEEVIQGQQKQKNDRSGNNTRNQGLPPAADNNMPPVLPVPVSPAAPTDTTPNENGADNLQFSEFITIVADERSNAIIVYGTHSDIRQITRLIDDIDVLLPQVKIKVLIAEITLNQSDESGINRLGLTGDLSSSFDGDLSIGGPGFGADVDLSSFSFDLILNAVNRDSNAKILSNPEIVTTHNQEASINVSESRPIITGTTTSTINADTSSSTVQYRDIGIQLTVTPLIGSSGVIQLEIEQTVENIIDSTTVDGNAQPIIGRREAVTFISVNDGDVVILGGLQSRDITTSREGLFMLSDLPLIGDIFAGHRNDDQRREVMIFIQPEVINTREDAAQQLNDKLDSLEGGPAIRRLVDEGDVEAFDFEDRWNIARPLHVRPRRRK